MEKSNKVLSPVIKPTKLFCCNRISLKNENRSLNVFEHKVLDYILFVMLRSGITRITISAFEFFAILELQNPNGRQYKTFYKAVYMLYETSLFWINVDYGKCARIIQEFTFLLRGGKIAGFVVQLNPNLFNELIWKNSNIVQHLKISMKLKRKYSYFLFLFLLRNHISDGNCHQFRRMQLRHNLNVSEDEPDKHFKVYLRAAIKEINLIANMKLRLKIRKNLYFIWCEFLESKIENEIVTINNDANISEDSERMKISLQEVRRYEVMYQILHDNPELGRLMDEQTSEWRR